VTFSPSLEELRSSVESELERFLDHRRAALPEADLLITEIESLISSGGKRLRPAFCYWGYRAAGGEPGDAIVRAAASLELLHTFALVHDDVMDAAEERRGFPTAFARHGTGIAVLVGDLALVLADDLFLGAGFPHDVSVSAFSAYSRMRQQVIAGQYLDLEFESEPFVTEARARRMAVLKSGRYSVEEPLRIGALLASAPRELVDTLGDFGGPLGEAFQLRDDLLGIFGDPAVMGKAADADIRAGKRNLLYAKTLAALDSDSRAAFVERWGKGEVLSSEEVERLRDLVESSGARAQAERLLADLTASARARLEQVPIAAPARAALSELARLATDRPA
jgi:geranylgeranyl diphosphate synthase, type I